MHKKSNEIWTNFSHFLGNRKSQDEFNHKFLIEMKKIKQICVLLVFSLLASVFYTCSSSGDDIAEPEVILPSNLVITIDVVGKDAAHPNGDGTGVINIEASATNAVKYGFKFENNAEQQNTNGKSQFTYTNLGTNTYNFTVYAYSSTNNSVNVVKSVTVFVESQVQAIIPSNLSITTNIVGADTNNLYGDGSGVVNFIATATDAVSYGFVIDNEIEQQSTDGTYQYTFNNVEGIENHEIKVFAYSSTDDSIDTNETVPVAFYNGALPFWADEFFESGAPNPENWNYNLGTGTNGWGNNEEQTYTNNAENVIVEEGLLKITAKKDNTVGYTSARIKSQSLKEFTYGTVKVRAKLPAAQGTWPAIWMLGANFGSVGWPACGEIDIMEQTGANKTEYFSTLHWSNSGNYASYGTDHPNYPGDNIPVPDATTSFRVYTMEWTETALTFYVDDELVNKFVMDNNSSLPFNSDFFFILNIAMGGTLGGTIDSGFTQDTMEIDYVRVYK
ncbi:glycoside hydrolase family 16 protein [Wocania ichthyoenteri]|uniref:glycoside hydrolase family 16 protein n=1 Tax=Wocania ichthyoenteri TaxID=1230531 RepID=UPI00068A04BD|nr:glycoside hydrolase family 16 protein [Wocania ichthyoenteri]